MLKQLTPFIRALRQQRSLQFQYQRAAKNPFRREEIKSALRDSRILCEATAELLRDALEVPDLPQQAVDQATPLYQQYQRVRKIGRNAHRDKLESQYKELREAERKLDRILATFKFVPQ